MTEVNVSPNGADSGATLMAIVLIIALVVVGLFAYNNGWFNDKTADDTDVNISIPSSTKDGDALPTLGETSGSSF